MKSSAIDLALKHIDDKIDALRAAKEHLLAAHEALGLQTNGAEPKVRKMRKRKGLPSATPPASEANLLGKL